MANLSKKDFTPEIEQGITIKDNMLVGTVSDINKHAQFNGPKILTDVYVPASVPTVSPWKCHPTEVVKLDEIISSEIKQEIVSTEVNSNEELLNDVIEQVVKSNEIDIENENKERLLKVVENHAMNDLDFYQSLMEMTKKVHDNFMGKLRNISSYSSSYVSDDTESQTNVEITSELKNSSVIQLESSVITESNVSTKPKSSKQMKKEEQKKLIEEGFVHVKTKKTSNSGKIHIKEEPEFKKDKEVAPDIATAQRIFYKEIYTALIEKVEKHVAASEPDKLSKIYAKMDFKIINNNINVPKCTREITKNHFLETKAFIHAVNTKLFKEGNEKYHDNPYFPLFVKVNKKSNNLYEFEFSTNYKRDWQGVFDI